MAICQVADATDSTSCLIPQKYLRHAYRGAGPDGARVQLPQAQWHDQSWPDSDHDREDLLAVRNFGEKSLNELKDSLKERGLLPTPAQLERFNESNLNGAHRLSMNWMRTTTTHSA